MLRTSSYTKALKCMPKRAVAVPFMMKTTKVIHLLFVLVFLVAPSSVKAQNPRQVAIPWWHPSAQKTQEDGMNAPSHHPPMNHLIVPLSSHEHHHSFDGPEGYLQNHFAQPSAHPDLNNYFPNADMPQGNLNASPTLPLLSVCMCVRERQGAVACYVACVRSERTACKTINPFYYKCHFRSCSSNALVAPGPPPHVAKWNPSP